MACLRSLIWSRNILGFNIFSQLETQLASFMSYHINSEAASCSRALNPMMIFCTTLAPRHSTQESKPRYTSYCTYTHTTKMWIQSWGIAGTLENDLSPARDYQHLDFCILQPLVPVAHTHTHLHFSQTVAMVENDLIFSGDGLKII